MVFLVQPIIAYVDGRQVINTPVTKTMQDVCSSSSDELCSCVTGELSAWTTRLFNAPKQTRRRKAKDADSRTPEVHSDLSKNKVSIQIRDLGLAQIRRFTLEELRVATKEFSANNLVGEGGFGRVYKGELGDNHKVAIKRHEATSMQGEEEFLREVQVSSLALHRNLLPLCGYCHTDKERLLVYPYVSNGDLHHHLERGTLDWRARQKIALGIARGLAHMHDSCFTRIIHRDVKPSNVLLDDGFEPFLSDFGLAIPIDKAPIPLSSEENAISGTWSVSDSFYNNITHISTRVLGTYGYAAPEYVATGHCSEKVDVYAFGVIVLQLVSGHDAAFLKVEGDGKMGLVEWARKLIKQKKIELMVDCKLQVENIQNEIHRMIKLGLLCTMCNHKRRPKMSEAIRILEGVTPLPGWKKLRKELIQEHS